MSIKTALVTGATDGIGRQTALELGHKGFRVLVHGRSPAKAEAAVAVLAQEAPTGTFVPVSGDFSSLSEVRGLAQQVLGLTPVLDVLINNAGIKAARQEITIDGFDATWAVNHLAPFLLTNLLLDAVKQADGGRIVTVSSMAHQRGHINFDDLNALSGWESYRAYAQSKLANVLFSNRLSTLLSRTGTTSNAVHPGTATTKLLLEGFGMHGKSVAAGAAPSVALASDPKFNGVTGRYFGPQGEEEPSVDARNEALQERLWLVSQEQTGITKEQEK